MRYRARKFFYHVNRHVVRAGGANVWTLHYRGRCIPVNAIVCEVPTQTLYDPAGRQPRCKVVGQGQALYMANSTTETRAIIVNSLALVNALIKEGWMPL